MLVLYACLLTVVPEGKTHHVYSYLSILYLKVCS